MATLLLSAPAHAQEARGFVEVRAHASIGVDGEPIQVIERVRPEFSTEISDRVALSTTVEPGLTQGRNLQEELERTLSASDLGPILDALGCTWPEPDNPFLGVSGVDDYLRVERLYLDVYLPWADLRLGRQALQWGSAFLVNPTDPFPEVLLVEPWRPRAGVNSLRATVPIGDAHQVQAVVGTDDAFRKVRLAGRATVNALETDFSVVGAYREESSDGLVGLDIRGTLGVGFWVEGAVHLREDPYEEIAVGVDYSFPVLDMLVVTGQYYRNGAGSKEIDPADLTSGISTAVEPPDCGDAGDLFETDAEPDPFAPFFSGRDYGLLSVMLAISPEVSATALWVQNLGDGSGLLVPMLSTFPTGWLEVSLVGQIPLSLWGDGGELHPATEDLVMSVDTGADPIEVDMNGLVPDATLILSTQVNF